MNITQKHRYALSVMVQLGFNFQQGPIQLRILSDAAKVPHAYLEQLILDLKKSGLVKSTRGAKGGYQLSRNVADISVNDIFSAIDPLKCEVLSTDQLAFFWSGLNDQVNHFLKLPLDSIMNDVIKKEQVLTYSI